MKQRVLITGATGFIGRELVKCMESAGHELVAVVRQTSKKLPVGISQLVISHHDSNDVEWGAIFADIESVVHLAGVAHASKHSDSKLENQFYDGNVRYTAKIAEEASRAGVKRFIFVSSIGVNGEVNTKPFTADDVPAPVGHYAKSKFQAEQELNNLKQGGSKMEIVIVRPPMVYGVGALGAFGLLYKAIKNNYPLPLGATENLRSFIAIDNVVDFIETCVSFERPIDGVFLVSDSEDISTTDFIKKIKISLDRSLWMISLPKVLIVSFLRVIGARSVALSLFGSLTINIDKSRDVLNWEPKVTIDEALRRMLNHKL